MTRPVSFSLARVWDRNPNYRHGGYSKRRGVLETRLRRAMAHLSRLAASPRAPRAWVAELLADHPSRWTKTVPRTKAVLLPAREMGHAAAWIASVERCALRAVRIFRYLNDHRNDARLYYRRPLQPSPSRRESAAPGSIGTYLGRMMPLARPG